MTRYSLFTLMHKAMRAMLYDAALTLQQTCFTDAGEAETALQKIGYVLFLFKGHTQHEDNFVLPAIMPFERPLADDFEKEHVTSMALADRLKHLLNIFRNTACDEEKIFCGSAISKSFIEFMVFNLQHMAREELFLNPVLWKHYTDEQLILLNHQMVCAIPNIEKTLRARWMIRGVNNHEAIYWLNTVKLTAPAFIFGSLLNLIGSELPECRREKIHAGLLKAAMVEA